MGGCGYRLCQRNGIKEIADCENSVVYVCNGEMWEAKDTEKNKRCAKGELEYCDACFEEGKFEGHYKCEGGKWRKYGMGDEICEHITDVKCEFGTVGCGACDAPENKEVRDCVTGRDFVCQNNFWTAVVVDCDALTPECGYSEYDLLILGLQPKIAFSTGSACTSGIQEPSHVLKAIGLSTEEAERSFRITVGRFTNADDVDAAIKLIG